MTVDSTPDSTPGEGDSQLSVESGDDGGNGSGKPPLRRRRWVLITGAILIVVATLANRGGDEAEIATLEDEPQTVADEADEPAAESTTTTTTTTTVSVGLTVAFIGDQGSGTDARSVLELIRDEGADMVLHQGDFDYDDDPDSWDQLITEVLGRDFPYFASVGNHDESVWSGDGGYQSKLTGRLARIPEASCSGELGVKSSCTFRGLFFILSGAGTLGSDHETYIRDELARTQSRWRICSWHKDQEAMQVGGKGDSTGWDVYEECRMGGAIIATAHEHSYERTRTLVDMSTQSIDPNWPLSNQVRVAPGATFAFVSGLGGRSVRDQERCLPTTPPYGCDEMWASIYTSDQGATFGALFCSFGIDAQAQKATCWFKDINGNVPDQFTVTNFN